MNVDADVQAAKATYEANRNECHANGDVSYSVLWTFDAADEVIAALEAANARLQARVEAQAVQLATAEGGAG